jgi:hypothetical protein
MPLSSINSQHDLSAWESTRRAVDSLTRLPRLLGGYSRMLQILLRVLEQLCFLGKSRISALASCNHIRYLKTMYLTVYKGKKFQDCRSSVFMLMTAMIGMTEIRNQNRRRYTRCNVHSAVEAAGSILMEHLTTPGCG